MKKWKKYEPGWYWINEKLPVRTWPWVDSERTCILSPNSLTYIYQAVVDENYHVRARVDSGWIFAEDIRKGRKTVMSYLDATFSIEDHIFTGDEDPDAHVKHECDLDQETPGSLKNQLDLDPERPGFWKTLFTIQVIPCIFYMEVKFYF